MYVLFMSSHYEAAFFTLLLAVLGGDSKTLVVILLPRSHFRVLHQLQVPSNTVTSESMIGCVLQCCAHCIGACPCNTAILGVFHEHTHEKWITSDLCRLFDRPSLEFLYFSCTLDHHKSNCTSIVQFDRPRCNTITKDSDLNHRAFLS